MAVPGFEHHTFACSECHDVERRLVFTKHGRESATQPMPVRKAPPIVPASTVRDEHVSAQPSRPVEARTGPRPLIIQRKNSGDAQFEPGQSGNPTGPSLQGASNS
jgi:hypothetical protein